MALPARIGRYRVLGLLGRGAMGVVYRGRDERLDRDVAVKVMAVGDVTAEGRERFLREARSVARLQHPNIVVIYELGEHEGAPFMAIELMEGKDLQRAIAGGLRPDPRATVPIVLQVLAGLGHAHEHGIVHRDVKPSNVFLPRGRPAKVMDFGVARLAAGTTAAGVMVGTPNYMSPEQVRTGLVDGRSDLFSAGLILYELVTGEKVYQADNVVSLLYKIAHEEPALRSLPEGPPWQRLRSVVTRALARAPEDRYPDAHRMSDDLVAALADLGGPAPRVPEWDDAAPSDVSKTQTHRGPAPAPVPAPSAPPTAGEPSRRLALVVLAVAAASLMVGVALFVSMQPPAAEPQPRAASPSASPIAAAAPEPGSPEPSAAAAAPSPVPASASPEPVPAPVMEEPATPSPPAVSPPAPQTRPAAPPDPGPGRGGDAARLERANDLYERGRYAAALAEARIVLRRNPGNAEARTLVEDAEAAVVVEERIKKAREALRQGDRERALQEAKAGLAVAPSDARLLALFKEATR